MSGEAGVWPIGPAAKPAKPAPSVTRPSQFVDRHQLGRRLRVHVDELREEELDARPAPPLSRIASAGDARSPSPYLSPSRGIAGRDKCSHESRRGLLEADFCAASAADRPIVLASVARKRRKLRASQRVDLAQSAARGGAASARSRSSASPRGRRRARSGPGCGAAAGAGCWGARRASAAAAAMLPRRRRYSSSVSSSCERWRRSYSASCCSASPRRSRTRPSCDTCSRYLYAPRSSKPTTPGSR